MNKEPVLTENLGERQRNLKMAQPADTWRFQVFVWSPLLLIIASDKCDFPPRCLSRRCHCW